MTIGELTGGDDIGDSDVGEEKGEASEEEFNPEGRATEEEVDPGKR